MGTRATLSLASLGLGCLRRQLHVTLEKQQGPLSGSLGALVPVASSLPVDGQIDGGQAEPWHLETNLLDRKASSFGGSQQVPMKDSFGSVRHLRNMSPSQDSLKGEWITDEEATFVKNQDFFSRYLQWGSHDRSVYLSECQNYPEVAAVSAVDTDGLLSLTRENCETSFPHLLRSCSSLNFHEEPSMIIPLEADSVKRKRKKKMNKHKQRKLRRRDRHRN